MYTHTHTGQIHCPLELPMVCLSSSCFSTHPHCCHSGQEAVGEIRMTKSLFIKLAKSVCAFGFPVCVCVCLFEREGEKQREKEKEQAPERWGWGPKPRARGLSKIHSRLIPGYCCLKPWIKNRGYGIKNKRLWSYIHNNISPLQETEK